MTRYILNKNTVLREDENIVFDSNKFIVHKFNSEGFSIIKHFSNGALTQHELTSLCPEISNDDLAEFIVKASAAGILISYES